MASALQANLNHRWRLLQDRLEGIWRRICITAPWAGQGGTFAWEVLRKYHRDDCFTHAAGVSFFLTISLIPLATLFFRLLALLLRSQAYSHSLQKVLLQFYPFLPDHFISEMIRHSRSREMQGWGLSWIILIIGAHWGVNQLDKSLSHIFGLRVKPHRQTRHYHALRRLGLVLGGLVFLVIFLSAGFEWSLHERVPFPSLWLVQTLPPFVGLFLVTFVLQHLPRRHVRFRHAFLGALVSTALWLVAKWGFGIYLDHTPTWGILYGSLSSLMAGLIFLYYSCCIFLLGAEITATFYRHETTTEIKLAAYQRSGRQSPSRP